MKIIHLYGANASGKSTLLKQLEGELANENIKVLREHQLDTIKVKFTEQLKIYEANSKKTTKKTAAQLQEETLTHNHMLVLLSMGQTLNEILKGIIEERKALVIEGNCFPVVEALMNSVNNNSTFDPELYPKISSIYLHVDPEEAAKRNIRRMDQYYKLDPSLINTIKNSNIAYQKTQVMKYDQLARSHGSEIVISTPSIDETAANLKEIILALAQQN